MGYPTNDAPVTDPDAVGVPISLPAAIDDALARLRGRSLVSGAEVVDMLLDLRTAAVVAPPRELAGAPAAG